MTAHHLDPARDTVTDSWDPAAAPVITVRSGDTLTVRTLDSEGYLEPIIVPGGQAPMLIGGHAGHCLAGPIEVADARPGQVLAVTFVDLVPAAWGWTAAATGDGPLNRRLGMATEQPAHLLWQIDAEQGTARNQLGFQVRIAPFLGVVGMPPAEPGRHSTFPPRTVGGGNLDCAELVAGSTIFLPITVPGAMLCVGDGHAAQGDGEASGTAVECGMTTTLRLELLDAVPVAGIHALTPTGRVTFGFDADLNEAMAVALQAMVDWLATEYHVSRSEALALASVAAHLRITQVANGTWGAHALLAHDALERR